MVKGRIFRIVSRLANRLRPTRADVEPVDAAEARDYAVSRNAIRRLTGFEPKDLGLYERALTHRSMLRGRSDSHLFSNERLEFLGDAVLGLVVAEHLWLRFPNEDEGFLTRLRSKLVNGQALARNARSIQLGPLLLVSENMEQTGGRDNLTILADAFEAIIGAIYVDLGLEQARTFIQRTMLDHADLVQIAQRHDNYKSLLLEHVQAMGWPQPQYRLKQEEGPSHEKIFTVEVLLREEPYGSGTANSKKKAEQRAASEALRRLKKEEAAQT